MYAKGIRLLPSCWFERSILVSKLSKMLLPSLACWYYQPDIYRGAGDHQCLQDRDRDGILSAGVLGFL